MPLSFGYNTSVVVNNISINWLQLVKGGQAFQLGHSPHLSHRWVVFETYQPTFSPKGLTVYVTSGTYSWSWELSNYPGSHILIRKTKAARRQELDQMRVSKQQTEVMAVSMCHVVLLQWLRLGRGRPRTQADRKKREVVKRKHDLETLVK